MSRFEVTARLSPEQVSQAIALWLNANAMLGKQDWLPEHVTVSAKSEIVGHGVQEERKCVPVIEVGYGA